MAMRVACHGITWGRQGLTQCVQELRQLGFRGFEAFAFVADDFGHARLDEFKELLARYELELVALYGGGAMHDPSRFEEIVAANVRLARFLQANGANRLVLGPHEERPERGPSRDDLLNAVHCMNEIGRRTLDYGVLACIHPHFGTIVEKMSEIDFVMDRVDPRYVAMAADTAQIRKSNPEVSSAEVDVFRRYAERIKYVHLKDWDPTMSADRTGTGDLAIIFDFVELGLGVINLRECMKILRESGYDGWLTIEIDYTRRTPYESVKLCRDYLVDELGLTL